MMRTWGADADIFDELLHEPPAPEIRYAETGEERLLRLRERYKVFDFNTHRAGARRVED